MPKLLIATGNMGKVREIEALLAVINLDLVIPKQLGIDIHVEETGTTYAENAKLKAIAYAQASGLPSLADDSGLEVDALAGAPGLKSARYSPKPGATDADRRAYLLQNLQPHPRPWTARFRATMAIALPDGTIHFVEGICPGEIIPQARGTGGFGYDPIFLLTELGYTMAELSLEEKNRLSHRAKAANAARPILVELVMGWK